ncbi:MAG TPA: acyl carrier protein [Bryobacteraceae bacterium]|jgi:acyl carrier protein|nr:acyl carrier protein [Bryobacteraceae bacterium]
MTETIEQRLNRVFQEIFDDDSLEIRPEMTADDVDGWDSITHIVLIAAVEREFKVDFTTAEVTGLKNVGDLIALIEKKTSK